jgi:carbonic anhydrase
MPTAKILARIETFQDDFQENREQYERLATQGQAPKVFIVTCSDSRVPPELITSAEVGDFFVARNVANIVPPYGSGQMSMGADIEYAVLNLHVEHIVICGHTDCGGIKALDSPLDWSREAHIARWIDYARAAQTQVEASGLPLEERHLATVRQNVLLQMENLRSYDPVREGERTGRLRLHGWVYHLETGRFEAHDWETGGWSPVSSA